MAFYINQKIFVRYLNFKSLFLIIIQYLFQEEAPSIFKVNNKSVVARRLNCNRMFFF